MIQLFLNMYENNYYHKYTILDIQFKNKIDNYYESIKNKVIEKAKEQEILFTILPYNMSGYTIYKKLAAKYKKN